MAVLLAGLKVNSLLEMSYTGHCAECNMDHFVNYSVSNVHFCIHTILQQIKTTTICCFYIVLLRAVLNLKFAILCDLIYEYRNHSHNDNRQYVFLPLTVAIP